eukprot:7021790-Alexandrium_andersonii.AAC.1
MCISTDPPRTRTRTRTRTREVHHSACEGVTKGGCCRERKGGVRAAQLGPARQCPMTTSRRSRALH